MSEHHIESIVEQTIGFLDSHDSENLELRFYLLALYDFQCEFDTSNTYFRVMEDLLKHRFFFRLPLKEVLRKFKKVDESDEVMVNQGWVYARFDTPTAALWSQVCLIDTAEPADLGQVSIAKVVKRIMEVECEQNDFYHSYLWFAALADQQFQNEQYEYKTELNAFKRDPNIKAFRDHCKKIKAARYVEDNFSEYPFSDFSFDEMDLESSNIIRWLSGKSASQQSFVDCFSGLDNTILTRPSKVALGERQALGVKALEQAHKQRLGVHKFAELISEATLMIFLGGKLGPWGALYGIRFTSEAIKPVLSEMNQAFICDSMVGLLCSADEFKLVIEGGELPESYKQLIAQDKRRKHLIKLFYPANDDPNLFYVDENGFALADHAERIVLTVPSKVAIESIYTAITSSVIPKRRGHPYHLLEVFKKVRNTKTKAKYRELLMQKINELSESDKTWFDVDHAAQCVFGVKSV